jgi:hypothetical protein
VQAHGEKGRIKVCRGRTKCGERMKSGERIKCSGRMNIHGRKKGKATEVDVPPGTIKGHSTHQGSERSP